MADLPKVMRTIQSRLRPGYRITAQGHQYRFFSPEGNMMRNNDGEPLLITPGMIENSPMYDKLIQDLRKFGAIPPAPKRRRRHQESVERRTPEASTNPILLARAIIADPNATGRERKMAKEYLNTVDALAREQERFLQARAFAQNIVEKLNERARELGHA